MSALGTGNLARYAKAAVAAVGSVATVLVATLPADNAVARWAAVALAVLTALGVAAVPNARTIPEAVRDLDRAHERAGLPVPTDLPPG